LTEDIKSVIMRVKENMTIKEFEQREQKLLKEVREMINELKNTKKEFINISLDILLEKYEIPCTDPISNKIYREIKHMVNRSGGLVMETTSALGPGRGNCVLIGKR